MGGNETSIKGLAGDGAMKSKPLTHDRRIDGLGCRARSNHRFNDSPENLLDNTVGSTSVNTAAKSEVSG
jgi:hypothetical protein